MASGELQSEILARSTELFARKGFDAVTMREIAAACSITLPTIYYYFRDKRALYDAVVLRSFAVRDAELVAAMAEGPRAPRERLKIFFVTLVRQLSQSIEAQLIEREMLDGGPDRLHALSQTVLSPAFHDVCQIIQEIAPGEHAAQVTFLLSGLAHGSVKLLPLRDHLPELAEDPLDGDALALLLWRVTLHWLTGEPMPVDATDSVSRAPVARRRAARDGR
jgi:AcrR family transcriptional regulator